MFCIQCGKATASDARFCGNCGAPAQEKSNAGAPPFAQNTVPSTAQRPEAMAKRVRPSQEKKRMHIAAYIGLCFGAWVVGAIVAHGISDIMGILYGEATAATVLGFWLGKVVLKNKARDWGGIVAFPIITFLAAFLGPVLLKLAEQNAESMSYSALISLVVAFALSCGLFAVLDSGRAR